MPRRPIVTIPHPVLRTPAQLIPAEELRTPEFKHLVKDMIETMLAADGIGLAANQIGISKQLCVVTGEAGPVAYVNPRIVKHSFRKETAEEGCLSIPGVFGLVRRPKRIVLEALDVDGKALRVEATGIFARIIQHEVDHLQGKLFIDNVLKITKGSLPKHA